MASVGLLVFGLKIEFEFCLLYFAILSIDSIFLISIFNHSFVGSSLTLIFFFTLGFPLSPYNLFLIFFTKYIHKHFGKF